MYVLNTIFYNVFFCIHYLSGRMIFLSCKCFNRKNNQKRQKEKAYSK